MESTIPGMSPRTEFVPIVKMNELKLGHLVGKGHYSTVYSAMCRGDEVAVKVLNDLQLDEEAIKAFKKEVDIMSRIRHKNIVLLMGTCTEDLKALCIITELLQTNLQTLLHSPNIKLSNLQKINFCMDTALGMAWLHNAQPVKIIHRDLKPSNLLLDVNWRVKVADFGLSCLYTSDKLRDKKNATGSALWMAPEVLLGKELNDKLDVYSYGLVLWEIFVRKEPYNEYKTVADLREAVCMNKRPIHNKKLIPSEMFQIMESCWHHQPDFRPSFFKILDLLKHSVIEVELVECPLMQLLWKKHFLGEEQVSSKIFNHILCQYFHISYEQSILPFKCLDVLLTTEKKKGSDSTPEVNIQRLGLLLSWFGPLLNCPWQPESTILDRIVSILSHSWFFGDIERDEAESILLEKCKKGSFLVRLNLGQSVCAHISPFVISTVTKTDSRKIEHYRVYHTKDRKGFSIQVQTKKRHEATHLCANGDITNLIALFVRKSSIKSTIALGQKYKKLFENSESMYLEEDQYSYSNSEESYDSDEQ